MADKFFAGASDSIKIAYWLFLQRQSSIEFLSRVAYSNNSILASKKFPDHYDIQLVDMNKIYVLRLSIGLHKNSFEWRSESRV